MTLDSIADSIGTVTEEQQSTDPKRVHEGDFEGPQRDVQTEYDGGL